MLQQRPTGGYSCVTRRRTSSTFTNAGLRFTSQLPHTAERFLSRARSPLGLKASGFDIPNKGRLRKDEAGLVTQQFL
eukprot:2494997-Heterocapsa_arctica.AAC.1